MPVESGKLKLNLKGKLVLHKVADVSANWLHNSSKVALRLAGGTPWVEKKKKKKKAKVLDISEPAAEEETPAETVQSGPTTTSESLQHYSSIGKSLWVLYMGATVCSIGVLHMPHPACCHVNQVLATSRCVVHAHA